MADALNAHADSSIQSLGTPTDLSLGSAFSATPARALRIPSTSTVPSSAPISTPSPPIASLLSRRKIEGNNVPLMRRMSSGVNNISMDDGEDDLLNTPNISDRKKWTETDDDIAGTPVATRIKRSTRASMSAAIGTNKGVTLTLRDQEKHIDSLKKENFSIKLRVHFLEERLAQLAPDQIEAALKLNITLKVEVQQRGVEIKKLKKLVLELERELERLQKGAGGSSRARERELEDKLEERDRELRDLRKQLRSVQNGHSSNQVDEDLLRQVEDRNADLEEQLENARGLLQDNMDEMERLREMVQRKGEDDSMTSQESRRDRLKRRLEELENENEDLRNKLQDTADILEQRENDREDLADEVDALRLEIEDIQQRREAENIERSESRAQILEEREEREAVEDDLNALRDKLAAAMIELQQKEDEVDEKNQQLENIVKEHDRIVQVVEDEWRGEVEEARGQVEELRDVLAERETESKDLRLNLSELESNTNDLHAKFEAALAHLEEESEEKDTQIQSLTDAIEKLSEQIYVLEDENDKMKEDSDRLREDEEAERERLEALSAALKEKIANLKSELEEMTELYETCNQEIHTHRDRQEELAQHVEDLVEQLERERQSRTRLQEDIDIADKEHDAEIRQERRALEAKESALQSALADLARTQSLLSQRNVDLEAVQNALLQIETESKKAGETHTTARFSLQLEVDRLRRDVERLEAELERARKEVEDRESRGRDRDGSLDQLHAQNRELASQLAAQTQARLNVSEKLDSTQGSLKTAEGEISAFKARITDLEQRLSKDQRLLLSAESQYRDQLTERNTLLLTIYQYLDKIVGVDKTPKKAGAETKPFTNFSVFHDNLITRLKAMTHIQTDFEKRCKEAEGRYAERMAEMRKQLDNRWKQIDKFEASVKTYADTKTAWRRKLTVKEGELEAIKATNAEMAAQLAGIKRPGQSDAMEVRSLSARATNAERRLINAQNQLLATEEKMASVNQKTAVADSKWEARVKEYEARLKAAEERVKRERQGGKERIAELENELKTLQRQIELAKKRNQQLNDVIDTNKLPPGTPGPSR